LIIHANKEAALGGRVEGKYLVGITGAIVVTVWLVLIDGIANTVNNYCCVMGNPSTC